jgi:hypothetical protein
MLHESLDKSELSRGFYTGTILQVRNFLVIKRGQF